MRDQLLQRYVRYLNYAEALRLIAAHKKHSSDATALTNAADQYDQMAVSLNSILRAKANLEGL